MAIRSHAVHTYSVARKMLLGHRRPPTDPLLIYATQSDTPRIALIGHDFTLPPEHSCDADNYLTVSVLDDAAANAPATTQPADANVVTAAALAPDATTANPPKDNSAVTSSAACRPGTEPLTSRPRPARRTSSHVSPGHPTRFPPTLIPTHSTSAFTSRVIEMLSAMCNDHSINAKFVRQRSP